MEFLREVSPRDYQEKIFQTCAKKNCLVVLPTGLGKTLIALMLTVKRMTEFPGEKVLFLAPTKPLVEQHFNYFKKHLTELFGEMNMFTGSISAEKRKKSWDSSDIIFSTPQCIGNDLKKNLYNLSDVCLLVEDEAHKILGFYDYVYVAKKYNMQSKNPRILGLTASPGSEISKIKEICKNLLIEDVEIRTRNSDDVKDYLQEMEFERVNVEFPKEFEEIKTHLRRLSNKYTEELRNRNLLFRIPTKTELISLQKKFSFIISQGNKNFNYMIGASICAQLIKLQHALELLETQTMKGFNEYLKNLVEQAEKNQSKGVVKLVSTPEFNFSLVKSEELLKKDVEHHKIEKVLEIIKNEKIEKDQLKIMIFTQFRDTASVISNKINLLGILKSKIFVGQLVKKNIGMTQKEQKKIIEEFSEGKIDILCATCIGEEGLDIPEVDAVIFYEPVASAIRTIQRSGRTARLSRGKVIVLVTKKTRDEAYYYSSKSKEKKMGAAISSIKEEMANGKKLKEDSSQKTIDNY